MPPDPRGPSVASSPAPRAGSPAAPVDLDGPPAPDAFGPHAAAGPLGVHRGPAGTQVALVASRADQVWLCLLDEPGLPHEPGGSAGGSAGGERRVPLTRRAGGVWTALVPDLTEGQRYGFRVAGPWDPAAGQRHDPAKLLLDPYARALTGAPVWGPALFSHPVGGPTWSPVPGASGPSGLDSAGFVPHGVVLTPPVADQAARPRTPWTDTVIYEAHLRGLTRRHPAVPEGERGTWAGLAHPAVLEHLLGLGVSAVELLPVQAAMTEVPLARRGQENAWGYSTLSWFAPDPRFASAAARAAGPAAVVAEVAAAVAALHAAGLEVLLDVVLNHSCEGAAGDGPTVSLRGLDAATYYRLDSGGRDVDSTGCGNSLDFGSPRVVALALDSLRHWVRAYGVDGFRFDLAPTLARGRDGRFSPDHPFLVAAAADPVLADVKLIAEPWDLGPDGWRTGSFPLPFADWNDAFRDDVRDFWLSAPRALAAGEAPGAGLSPLSRRLSGSADRFGTGRTGSERGPSGGVSFVTAHDGFTLADLTAFEHKHNEANGEDNRDGSDNNRSWNHGAEGWLPAGPGSGAGADALMVEALRRRSMRNLLGTLLLSAGVPMITAGDELGRTQGGNNNAYCLDDPTTWMPWELAPWQEDLRATTSHLLGLRRAHPVLRPEQEPAFPGQGPAQASTAVWFDARGSVLSGQQWQDEHVRTVQVLLTPAAGVDAHPLLLVVHGQLDDAEVVLPASSLAPPTPAGPPPATGPTGPTGYRLLWNSADERPRPAATGTFHRPGDALELSALSLRLYLVGP